MLDVALIMFQAVDVPSTMIVYEKHGKRRKDMTPDSAASAPCCGVPAQVNGRCRHCRQISDGFLPGRGHRSARGTPATGPLCSCSCVGVAPTADAGHHRGHVTLVAPGRSHSGLVRWLPRRTVVPPACPSRAPTRGTTGVLTDNYGQLRWTRIWSLTWGYALFREWALQDSNL